MVNRYKQTHKKERKQEGKNNGQHKKWQMSYLIIILGGLIRDMRNQERGRKIGGEKCQIVLKRLIGLCI